VVADLVACLLAVPLQEGVKKRFMVVNGDLSVLKAATPPSELTTTSVR
jgi:hypothetical protein